MRIICIIGETPYNSEESPPVCTILGHDEPIGTATLWDCKYSCGTGPVFLLLPIVRVLWYIWGKPLRFDEYPPVFTIPGHAVPGRGSALEATLLGQPLGWKPCYSQRDDTK